MLCILEDINQPRKRKIVYKFQEPQQEQPSDGNKNNWILPASILGAGGLVGGGLYYLAKNQPSSSSSPDRVFGIKIDPGIPLNADNW